VSGLFRNGTTVASYGAAYWIRSMSRRPLKAHQGA
jgi:hypothetical protein